MNADHINCHLRGDLVLDLRPIRTLDMRVILMTFPDAPHPVQHLQHLNLAIDEAFKNCVFLEMAEDSAKHHRVVHRAISFPIVL